MNVAIPMLLWCPLCHARHVDAGAFATKTHHTHACQTCGNTWRPAVVPTVGVQFLPGFKDKPSQEPAAELQLWRCGDCVVAAATGDEVFAGTLHLAELDASQGANRTGSYDVFVPIEPTESVSVVTGPNQISTGLAGHLADTLSRGRAYKVADLVRLYIPSDRPAGGGDATSDNTQLSDVDGPNAVGAEKIGCGPIGEVSLKARPPETAASTSSPSAPERMQLELVRSKGELIRGDAPAIWVSSSDDWGRGPAMTRSGELLTSELRGARLIVEAYRQLLELAKDACDQLTIHEDEQGGGTSDAATQLTAWLNNDDFVVKPEQLPPPLDELEPTRAGELLRTYAAVDFPHCDKSTMRIRDFDRGSDCSSVDYPVTEADEVLGWGLAHFIGTTEIDSNTWCSADQWSAIVRTLRIHGLRIVEEPHPSSELPTKVVVDFDPRSIERVRQPGLGYPYNRSAPSPRDKP